ncbi:MULTISPECIES: phosphatase PAP2 family protein [unclassified Actinomyces]|uniref:phosphatase PAP2 family protein n=1 Tax=unclassified Actinomyces TaxID=2609248 RepID=UPI0020182326|nr:MULTISPECIES: phosphatase PAP2 family protein [unclassified Actinomyces]MCL3777540.1 phosphatase PAP2 family protein [Actinomyces sp. AC-20-1]MCL3790637.1 phosphatase PAP2 family protein [Actinomyces sp. 187325]MCL3792928.1 phosphatase PAP2 family protein [Actinomyces sp. 186855]MCL3795373.1 phosphatase PAP2 family protein [Actinomyces sp. 217892]
MPATPSTSAGPFPHRRLVPALLAAGAVGLVLFAAVALQVVTGSALSVYDPTATAHAVGLRRPWLTQVAWVVTHLGGTTGLTLLTLLCCAVLAVRGRRLQAGVLAATMAGSAVLTMLLKLAFGRERPSVSLLLGQPSSSFAFPSGHSFNTAVLVGALAGVVLLSGAPRARKAVAVLAAVVAALLVGLSRVYLAYHWTTDVLAGWSLAVAWLSLVAVTVLTARGRREARAERGRTQE